MLHYQWSGRATVDILPRKKKKRSEVPITSLLGTAGSINRGLHMCFPRWVLECLLIARKCHPVTHKQIKKFIGAKVINYVWRIAQGFWKQYLQPPTQGGRESWWWGLLVLLASHTLSESYNLLFWKLLSPFMKWDFLEGVRGFCLAGCICLCNLSISWSLARGKRSQHVSDWKHAVFVKSPWLVIIAALRQIMSKECCYQCKRDLSWNVNVVTARLLLQYLLIAGWVRDCPSKRSLHSQKLYNT